MGAPSTYTSPLISKNRRLLGYTPPRPILVLKHGAKMRNTPIVPLFMLIRHRRRGNDKYNHGLGISFREVWYIRIQRTPVWRAQSLDFDPQLKAGVSSSAFSSWNIVDCPWRRADTPEDWWQGLRSMTPTPQALPSSHSSPVSALSPCRSGLGSRQRRSFNDTLSLQTLITC